MAIGVGIAGTSVGGYVYPSSVKFSRPLNARGTASCTLKIKPGDSYMPAVGQDFYIEDGATRVFGGSIDQIQKTRLSDHGGWILDISAVSNERKLDKRMVGPQTYKNMYAGDIVIDIVTNYAAGESIGLGTIEQGALIPKIVYDYVNVSDALDELAKASNFIWFLDPDSNLYFIERTTIAAPFPLTGADIINAAQGSRLTITLNRADFRDREYIRVSFNAFTPDVELFAGDGATTSFDLSRPVNRVESMTLTTNTRASVSGTFSGAPANGETIRINGVDYTFVTTIDNSLPRQVKIGATAAACAANFHAAVNDTGVGKGANYSQPTTSHPNCLTATPSGGTIVAYFKLTGSIGNGVTVSSASGAFVWSSGSMSGGDDSGTSTSVDFGVDGGDLGKAWYYSVGETTITQDSSGTPMAAGQFLEVTYRALGSDVMAVSDDAVVAARARVEGTTGLYEHFIDDSSNADAVGALAKAQAILDAYKSIPTVIECETRRNGLMPGQLLTLNIANPSISGAFLIDEVDGYYFPGDPHFRYKLRLIDSSRIGTWLQVWEKLAGVDIVAGGSTGSMLAITGGGSTTINNGGGSPNAPGNVTILAVTAIDVTNDAGDAEKQVTVSYAPPAPLGTFTGVRGFDDEPDSSVGLHITDGSVPADGNTPATGTFKPRDVGWQSYDPNNPSFVFRAPAVTSNQWNRVYLVSGSQNDVLTPIAYGQPGASPSYQYLMTPAATIGAGREAAPLMQNVGLAPTPNGWSSNPVYVTDAYGVQTWDVALQWTWPTNDQNFAQLGGFDLVLDDGAQQKFLGSVSVDLNRTSGILTQHLPVLAGTNAYKIYFVSYDTNGTTNTILAGVTPYVQVTIQRQTGTAGAEYAPLITDVSWTVATATGADGTVFLTVQVSGTAPADPTYGGWRLRALRPGDTTPITLASGRLLPGYWQGQNPASVQSWTFYLTSLDTSNNENTITASTPQTTVNVGSGSGLLNLGKASSSSFSTEFQIVGGLFKINALSAGTIVTGQLQVGGGGSKVSQIKIFDTLNSLIGWIGDDTGSSGKVGAWFKQVFIGGSSPTSAAITADSGGNVAISLAAGALTVNIDTTNYFKVTQVGAQTNFSQVGPNLIRTDAGGGVRYAQLSSSGTASGVDLSGTWSIGSAVFSMTALPSSNPGAGSKRFWYDPTDGNRVKFAP